MSLWTTKKKADAEQARRTGAISLVGGAEQPEPSARNGGDWTRRFLERNKISEVPVQELAGIVDIADGILVLRPGTRYRAFVSVGTLNYALMSAEEQNMVDAALFSFVMSLDVPVTFYGTAATCDTSWAVAAVHDTLAQLREHEQAWLAYGQVLLDELYRIQYSRDVTRRAQYVVLCYDANVPFPHARAELMRQAAVVVDALRRAGLEARVCTSSEVLDVVGQALNPESQALPSFFVGNGALSLYHAG